MKKFIATIVFANAEEATKQLGNISTVFDYLGSLNVKQFGEHKPCNLKITFLDYSFSNTKEIVLIIKCETVKLSEIEGKHKYMEFSKLFKPTDMHEEPNATA